MKPLVIYHGACDDGFAAAWCVRDALGKKDGAEFYAGVYQQDPPDVRGRDVVLVDFSYKRPILQAMQKVAKSILILDHHKTAMEDLSDLQGGDTTVEFDMARSGAAMAWDHYNPGIGRPSFIEYIQDRDLWRKELPNGDEFTIALRSYPQDFEIWDDLIASGPAALINEGHAIQRYYRVQVEAIKKTAYSAKLGGDFCNIANAPYAFASEVAGEIIVGSAQFGACYFEAAPGRWQYSLRSRDEFDVSAIAKQFGGGGHKAAAGFTVSQPVHTAV